MYCRNVNFGGYFFVYIDLSILSILTILKVQKRLHTSFKNVYSMGIPNCNILNEPLNSQWGKDYLGLDIGKRLHMSVHWQCR